MSRPSSRRSSSPLVHRVRGATALLALAASTWIAGCGAPGSHATDANAPAEEAVPLDWNVKGPAKKLSGHPVRVRYVAYLSQQNLEIVNESHSDPHALYSEKRPLHAVQPKVQSDEVVEALVERLSELGGTRHMLPGAAPAAPPSRAAQALELETEDGVRSWVVRESSPEPERKLFRDCVKDFVDLYNATVQYQAVDEAPEWRGASGTQTVRPPPKPGSSKSSAAKSGQPSSGKVQ
jgi:hypothetical protein